MCHSPRPLRRSSRKPRPAWPWRRRSGTNPFPSSRRVTSSNRAGCDSAESSLSGQTRQATRGNRHRAPSSTAVDTPEARRDDQRRILIERRRSHIVPPMGRPLTFEEYRLLVRHSPVMIWRSGLDAKCDYFNKTWLEFTGRTVEQEMGDGWAEGVHRDDLERCVSRYLDHFGRREPFEMEYRLRRHDGAYRWIFDRGVPFVDDNGTFAGFIGSCVDVDERRRAQDAEQQRSEQ